MKVFIYLIRAMLVLYVLPKNYFFFKYGEWRHSEIKVVKSIQKDGYCQFSGLLEDTVLANIQTNFDAMIDSQRLKFKGQQADGIYNSHIKFDLLNQLIRNYQTIVVGYLGQNQVALVMTLYQKSIVYENDRGKLY